MEIRRSVENFLILLCSLSRPDLDDDRSECNFAEVPLDFFDALKILGHGSQLKDPQDYFAIQMAVVSLLDTTLAHSASSDQ